MRGLALHGAVDDLLHLRGYRGLDLARRRRILNQPLVDMRQGADIAEWQLAGEPLIENCYAESFGSLHS